MFKESKDIVPEKFRFAFDGEKIYCLECGSHDVSIRSGMFVDHYYCNDCKAESIG